MEEREIKTTIELLSLANANLDNALSEDNTAGYIDISKSQINEAASILKRNIE